MNFIRLFLTVHRVAHPLKFSTQLYIYSTRRLYGRRLSDSTVQLEVRGLKISKDNQNTPAISETPLSVSDGKKVNSAEGDYHYFKNLVQQVKVKEKQDADLENELYRLINKSVKSKYDEPDVNIRVQSTTEDIDDTTIEQQFTSRVSHAISQSDIGQADLDLLDARTQSQKSLQITQDFDISKLKPMVPPRSSSLVAYINESDSLKYLVHIGVNLAEIEAKSKSTASQIVRMDFEKHIKPVIFFLDKIGLKSADMGTLITKNPQVLTEVIDDMQTRVNYLQSKRFSPESIARIVAKAPKVLTTPTHVLDWHLGFIQKNFSLNGNEVRKVITRLPKLSLWSVNSLKESRVVVKDFLGFNVYEQKQILLAVPKVYLTSKHALMQRFDYLHNDMGISHKLILAWPNVLRTRLSIIKPRYQFLKHLGRAQMDPNKENYVTLENLVTGRDSEFCKSVAKVSVEEFNEFLKTL